jgi:hypothetical protein
MLEEMSVKHAVLTGLFLTAAILASPVFAGNESSLCQINLQKVRDAEVSNQKMNEQLKGDIDTTVHRAEAALARNTDDGAKECLSLTTQAMQKIQSVPSN